MQRQHAFIRMRQLHLRRRHRAIHRIPGVRIEERQKRPDAIRVEACPQQHFQLAIIARVPHHRQLVPPAELLEIRIRHRQRLAPAQELRTFSKRMRHHIVDDAIVERIARHAHARMRQRLVIQPRRAHGKSHHREVARAPAEVRHQNGRVLLQPLRKEVSRRHRLIDVMDLLESHRPQRILIARPRQRLVRRSARKAHRPPDHHALGKLHPRMRLHPPQKPRQQILELQPPRIDLRVLEQRTRRKRLERLDEPALPRQLHEFVDRPRPRIHMRPPPHRIIRLRKAQHGPERIERFLLVRKMHRLDRALRIQHRGDSVRRAEIETDRQGHHTTPAGPTFRGGRLVVRRPPKVKLQRRTSPHIDCDEPNSAESSAPSA